MENINEGLARQNTKFSDLYRELLVLLQNELREKKKIISNIGHIVVDNHAAASKMGF